VNSARCSSLGEKKKKGEREEEKTSGVLAASFGVMLFASCSFLKRGKKKGGEKKETQAPCVPRYPGKRRKGGRKRPDLLYPSFLKGGERERGEEKDHLSGLFIFHRLREKEGKEKKRKKKRGGGREIVGWVTR